MELRDRVSFCAYRNSIAKLEINEEESLLSCPAWNTRAKDKLSCCRTSPPTYEEFVCMFAYPALLKLDDSFDSMARLIASPPSQLHW
jgi:hypothetical protein